jgi:hypothetical protein
MKRIALAIAIVLPLNLFVLAVSHAGATTNPFASMTPSQILIQAANGEIASGSVRVTDRITFPGVSTASATLDTSVAASREVTSARSQKSAVRIVDKKDFLFANEKYYIAETGKAQPSYVNKWVLIPKGNPLYVRTEVNQLIVPLIESVIQMYTLKDLGVTTFNGHQTVAVSGELPAGSVAPKSIQTVYVTTTAPYLIIGYSIKVDVNNVHGTIVGLFSHQGEAVNVAVPPKYLTAKA